MKKHEVSNIRFEGNLLFFVADNNEYCIDLRKHSQKLAHADDRVRMHYVISPAGYGIHWPIIDEDLSIDGLIRFVQKEGAASAA